MSPGFNFCCCIPSYAPRNLTHSLKLQIREAPHRSHHKFIEFYDIRAAEAALCALNMSDIAGKQIKLEPSRPGGVRRRF